MSDNELKVEEKDKETRESSDNTKLLSDCIRTVNFLKVTCMVLAAGIVFLCYSVHVTNMQLNNAMTLTAELSRSVELLYQEKKIVNDIKSEAEWMDTEEGQQWIKEYLESLESIE